ncbi:MAG: rhomboid family intramembrane serine protease [Bdellovibrio sp.]|nr:MAG: rhomboid family intramembrane serine protease [Bdellovibrio sp.]
MNGQVKPYVPPVTLTLKILIGLNVGIWLLGQVILEGYIGVPFTRYFALYPGKVLIEGHVWQLVTYMFLHTMAVSHILFNMLMLWFIGSELEQRWGPKFFLFYYFSTGIGAAVIYCVGVGIHASISGFNQGLVVPVLGASGAIFGLLLAYGILFGERIIHFMMIFPMKAKVFVLVLGAVEAVSILSSGVAGGDVANLAHLGGLLSGFLTLNGYTVWQRYLWSRKAKKRGRNLRLIVNNEPKDQKKEGPKYWH